MLTACLEQLPKSAPGANDQKEAAKRPSLSQDLSRLRNGLSDLAKNATPPKRSAQTKRDMSAFSFSLALLLLGTIAATNTNHPVFWLLLGPAPLAAGFTVLTFFRQRFSRCSPFAVFGKREDHRSTAGKTNVRSDTRIWRNLFFREPGSSF
jgi:hypothetical protein